MVTKRTFEENLVLAKARTKAVAAKAKPPAKAKQLSLELWPEAVRGVPNAVLRGALFRVAKERDFHKERVLIATTTEHEIRYKGETLNQTDLDLWETLLHLARLQPLGTQVEFTAHSLLKELGRGTGKSQHEQFKDEVARLAGGMVEITWIKEKKAFGGTLVSSYFRDNETGRYVVKFNTDMHNLYGMGSTYIDWEQRKALGKNNLAKWLHGNYASNATILDYKVETIRNLSGSTSALNRFRQTLKAALDQLVEIGAIKSWSIDAKTDLVRVDKVPSKAQRKHLVNAKSYPQNRAI
jgi:TrfA protein